VLIEGPGFVILGVNRKRAYTDNLGSLKYTQHRVLKNPGRKPFALPSIRDGKTGEQHNRHWIPGSALGQTLGSVVIIDLPHDKRVAADDLSFRQSNISFQLLEGTRAGVGRLFPPAFDRITQKRSHRNELCCGCETI